MTYDWIAALVFVGSLVAMMKFFHWAVFQIPALEEQRRLNHEQDARKLEDPEFKGWCEASRKTGTYMNLAFYAVVLPWCVDLDARPFWRHVVDVAAILLVFDFMYYWTHRSLFHGKALLKVHSLHHRARKPTFIDAYYVHPLETAIGLGLFLFSIPIVAWLGGAPVHAFSAAIATLVFTEHNTINHVYTNLPYQPYKWLNYVTGVHAAHHVNMKQGNYATLTMLYDWVFGTYEKPVHRPSAG